MPPHLVTNLLKPGTNSVTVFPYPSLLFPYLQAMHNRASLSPVVLLLPLVHLTDELQEGALRNRSVPVHGPPQELELLHHPIAVLGLQGSGEKQEK